MLASQESLFSTLTELRPAATSVVTESVTTETKPVERASYNSNWTSYAGPAMTLAAILLFGFFFARVSNVNETNVTPSVAQIEPSLEQSELVVVTTNDGIPTVQQWWNQATAKTDGLTTQVASGIRPVANSVSSAWNVFRNSMPGIKSQPNTPSSATQTLNHTIQQIAV